MPGDAVPVLGPAEEHGKTLARNAAFLFLGQVGSTALSIALSATLGRLLGAADFGVYVLLLSISTFAYVFVEWGQTAYLVREAAQRPEAQGVLMGSALVFRTIVAGVAVGFIVLLVRLLGYDGRTQALSALLFVCALPQSLSQVYTYLFRARDRMDLDAIVTIVAKALVVAITLPALYLGGRLGSLFVAIGLGGLGALATAGFIARRLRIDRSTATRAGLRELAVGGGSIAIFLIAIAAQPFLDVVILSKLVPVTVVGWYGAARNIMGVLTAPANILAVAAFPQMCRAASDIPQLRSVVRRSFRLMVALGALGSVGTFLFAEFAISLIFPKFRPAIGVLQAFAVSTLILFVDMALGNTVVALGRQRALAIFKVVSACVSTGLLPILVPYFQQRYGNGGLGVAVAFGLSEITMLVGCAWMLPRGLLNRDLVLDFGRAVLAGALTFVPFWFVLPLMNPWVALPACVATFGLLAWGLGLLDPAAIARVMIPMRFRAAGTNASD